jgi:hypothetical protein
MTDTSQRRDTRDIPLYTIPNIPLAKISARVTIFLFFPGLWTKRSATPISDSQVKEVYEQVIKPAAVRTNRVDAGLWPTSLDGERFRSGGSQSMIQMPSPCVTRFGDLVIQLAKEHLDYGENTFFLVDVRGHKSLSRHALMDGSQSSDHNESYSDGEDSRAQAWIQSASDPALRSFCKELDMAGLYEGVYDDVEAWIDVALEVQEESGNLMTAWRTSHHVVLVKRILGEIDLDSDDPEVEAQLEEEMKASGHQYIQDPTSTLTGISGFRFKVRASPISNGRHGFDVDP